MSIKTHSCRIRRVPPKGLEPLFYTLSECSLFQLDDSGTDCIKV